MRRLFSVLCALAISGCGEELIDGSGPDGEEVDINSEEIRSVGSPPWVYNGSLPALTDPKIVISLNGHTLRVRGALPSTFTGTIPFYATEERENNTRYVTVVYPIATGASANLDSPGRFYAVYATPFRPNGMAYPTTGPTFVNWGGFPFMAYNGGIAFHGPITYTPAGTQNGEQVYDWYLQRGPVSHGCNRMQGEHVVELAQLIGVDMRNTWAKNAKVSRRVHITVLRDYDRLASGEAVDVDYPRTAGARAPTGATRVFPTWNAEDFPRVVCADRRTSRPSNTPVPSNYCDYMPSNLRDLATGNPLAPVVIDNVSSAFRADSTWGTYTKSPARTGTNYRAIPIATAGTASWTLPVRADGRFRLWARYAPDTNRNTRVNYRVLSDGTAASASQPIVVDQRDTSTQGWVDLGTHALRAGAQITVSAERTSDGWTIADSVRIEPAE